MVRADLGKIHREAIAALIRLKVPMEFTSRDPLFMQADVARQQIAYLRSVADLIIPIFSHVADECADNVGSKCESVDILHGAITDYLSPLVEAIDAQEIS